MNNIIVAGYGPVGIAVEAAFEQHPHVNTIIDDPYLDRTFDTSSGTQVDGVVICVATPEADDGSCTTQNVQDVFDKYGSDCRYLIKSAIDPVWVSENAPPKTTVSPEFLRGTTGANPTKDFINQEYAIYGGGEMRWWHELLAPCLPLLKNIRFCSLEQAAFAKYVENTFLATKVTFFNEMYRIYQEMGFKDFDVMVDAITVDPRIGFSHTQVPGPDGKFGYGGHCLPKDMAAIRMAAKNKGAATPLLDAITEANYIERTFTDGS